LLRDCLASLRLQAAEVCLEVIVVDNGSSDGTPDMVCREFPEAFLIRNQDNRGFARASNQASRLAKGQYLFFLNNDTVVPAGALRRLLDYARTHPEAGMIGPRLLGSDGRVHESCRPLPTVATLLHRTCLLRWTGLLRSQYRRYRRAKCFEAPTTRPVESLMGAAVLLPREIFVACGGWDEDFVFGGEDFELSHRVGRNHAVVYNSEVVITHLGRASTRANVIYSAPHVAAGFARYLRKRGTRLSALFLYKLLTSLDVPLHLSWKLLEYFWRLSRGRHAKATKSRQRVKELWYFLTRGLIEFWKV
jgi:GT2 family glycosyltransferase